MGFRLSNPRHALLLISPAPFLTLGAADLLNPSPALVSILSRFSSITLTVPSLSTFFPYTIDVLPEFSHCPPPAPTLSCLNRYYMLLTSRSISPWLQVPLGDLSAQWGNSTSSSLPALANLVHGATRQPGKSGYPAVVWGHPQFFLTSQIQSLLQFLPLSNLLNLFLFPISIAAALGQVLLLSCLGD